MEPSAAIAAALAAGFLGSLHCVAMCGPLALAGSTRAGRVHGRELAGYLGGRLLAYGAVGALMGALGQHALCILPVRAVQLGTVVLVVAAALWQATRSWRRGRRPPAGAARVVALGRRQPPLWVRLYARLPRRGALLGVVTALLPCGMLLTAWLLAASTARPAVGAAVMLTFAAVSAPALLLPVVGQRVFARLAARVPAPVHGLAWGLLAAWVALRPVLAAAHHH